MEKINLSMSRIFKCDQQTLFQAIGEGMLFRYCGAKMDQLKMDFSEGGALHIEFDDCSAVNGIFKEIKPHSKIAFTWCFESDQSQKKIESLVTLSIHENNNKSTLTLSHDGLENFTQHADYNAGWDDALSDLHKSFRDLFAKLENNPTGLDLYFKLKKTIKAPRAQVFNAVFNHEELSNYFKVKASGPLIEGQKIEWKFENYPAFTLDVHQVVKNEMIKFQWGKSHVCFSFCDKEPHSTEVVIEATGWDANQSGLEDSYSECDGWMEFLVLLKFYMEKK